MTSRQRTSVTTAALLVMCATSAWAQPPVSSFSRLKDRLVIGQEITVTDSSGGRAVGRLSDMSDTFLHLLVDTDTRTFTAEDTRRVQQRRSDSLINGLLIGAAAGAGYGLYWYLRDPNECSNSVCASDLAIGAGIGAVIGLAIDAAIKENVTVYLASGSAAAVGVTSAPGHTGIQVRAAVAVRW